MPENRSLLDGRVNEDQVARILQLIATAPNRRELRQAGDLDGDYEYWFDGGAIRIVTGTTRFFFQDGTIAEIIVSPILSVHIRFRDGHVVGVHQER